MKSGKSLSQHSGRLSFSCRLPEAFLAGIIEDSQAATINTVDNDGSPHCASECGSDGADTNTLHGLRRPLTHFPQSYS